MNMLAISETVSKESLSLPPTRRSFHAVTFVKEIGECRGGGGGGGARRQSLFTWPAAL